VVANAVRLVGAVLIALSVNVAPARAAEEPPITPTGSATITRTAFSIPNITADDLAGAGYGVGYAQAEDQFCTLADNWLTLSAERSLHFGPGSASSDLYYAYINKTAPFERMMTSPPPHGPNADVVAMVDGYVAGYNAYLEHVGGAAGIPDARCRGKAWVRPISRLDVLRRMYQLMGLGGRDLVSDGMMVAEPPPAGSVPKSSAVDPAMIVSLGKAFSDRVADGGSNAVGLGSEATFNGSGMLLANPHWTWDGRDRFWQMHVKVPGELHVSGMGFIGQPLVMIGHNEHVAWSHTVSAARRLALQQLTLVPGQPTKYVVDGKVHTMDQTEVTVDVREKDGSVTQRSKTFWSSIYGPITTSILGIPALPWTQATAFALVDMNYDNIRIANQFMESNAATSVEELYRAHAKYSANPWATTTATDDKGNVLWTDVGTVPNVSNAFAARCNTAIGHALFNTFAVAVLNGAVSACRVPTAPTSAAPMIMPADKQPVQRRTDYVENSNESHWLTNAREPLEGYSRVFGPERSQRAMRTRLGHRIVLDRLDAQKTFTRQGLQDALFSNRNMLGELWADDLAAICRANPRMPSTAGTLVNVSEACDVIAKWDKTNGLDSPGAVLFQRFAELSYANTDFLTSYAGLPPVPMWKVPFVVTDPVNTPSGLNPAYAPAQTALADAVAQLRSGGVPLDATLRTHQLNTYGGAAHPLHGGQGELGMFNHMSTRWNGKGYSAGGSGPSFVMVTSFGEGCPDDRSLLMGSQRSASSGWPRATEQVQLYSTGKWVDPPFCDAELAAAPVESVTQLGPSGATG
jgi:acyl-homoserine-lactone acylase